MIDFGPPPKLWVPEAPAIIRPYAERREQWRTIWKRSFASFPIPMFHGFGSWHTTHTETHNTSSSSSWSGYTVRNTFATNSFSNTPHGDKWRVTFSATNSSGTFSANPAYFGVLAGTYGFSSTYGGQLLFSGGASFSLSAGTTIVSDALSITGSGAQAASSGLCVTDYLTGSYFGDYNNGSVTGVESYAKSGNDASTSGSLSSGYSTENASGYGVTIIENFS
jgi:hypothetical protein